MFMATLDNLVMTTALPVVRADLGSSVAPAVVVLNAYAITFATFMLPAAVLGDRLGRRRVMLAGIAVFTLASIASALSTTSEALIAARAVQGARRGRDHAALRDPARLAGAARDARGRDRHLGGVAGPASALGPVVGSRSSRA